MVGEKIFAWVESLRASASAEEDFKRVLWNAQTLTDAQAAYDALTPQERIDFRADWRLSMWKATSVGKEALSGDIAADAVTGAIDSILKKSQEFEALSIDERKKRLGTLTADVLKIAAAVNIAEMVTAKARIVPPETTSGIYRRTLAWVGFGAVLAAVAHDPVKIGFLRPYQDMLESTFRNRRPDDFALFQAYKTRELTPTKVDDLKLLDDTKMDAIEAENQKYYDTEIAKWGYSEWFAGALARSATRTLNFSQLNALARQGLLSRGLAIYSLWGEGLDRTVMKPALGALMQQNEIASYDGFRAQIERGYTDGLVSEDELKAYYAKLHIPEDVQKIMLPHMTKLREDTKKKAATSAAGPQRDLTVSQVQQAYEAALLDRAHAQNMILALGYSLDETKVLLDLADTRKKLPGASKLKRLPLTDYEKAFKAKLISQEAVLARMEGEYTKEDIAMEKKLLEAGKA